MSQNNTIPAIPRSLHRKSAGRIAADLLIGTLSEREKVERISRYYLGPENLSFTKASGFGGFPEELKEELRGDVVPTEYADRHEPLLKLALRSNFFGMRNEYLEEVIHELSGVTVHVYGRIGPLRGCVCCGYRAVPGVPGAGICLACFWEEDFSITDVHQYSGPNRVTLAEGRENVRNYGAVESSLTQYVVPGPERKYPRS